MLRYYKFDEAQEILLRCSDYQKNATLAGDYVWGSDSTLSTPTGSGTENDPYQLDSLDDLQWLSETPSQWGMHYLQTANINASATQAWNDEGTDENTLEGFSPIGNGSTAFKGSFNGQNYTIEGLTINRTEQEYVGLFGYAYARYSIECALKQCQCKRKKICWIAYWSNLQSQFVQSSRYRSEYRRYSNRWTHRVAIQLFNIGKRKF